MGRSGSGKTSMRSIIFANYLARETMRLGPTLGTENSDVLKLGNLTLTLWDCGGQDAFMEDYLERHRGQIFRNVEVLIYVFSVDSQDRKKDLEHYKSCLDALSQNSKDAKVFSLVHKLDLVRDEDKSRIYSEREQELKERSGHMEVRVFPTSIWDETLYKAWSSIVCSLVPNMDKLESYLHKFCKLCQADEVVLFEQATFLVISSAAHHEHHDVHRHEKISNIVKQFKLSCNKTSALDPSFRTMEVKNKNFTAFIEVFTSNTYIMIVTTDRNIPPAAIQLNVQVARPHFDKLVQLTWR